MAWSFEFKAGLGWAVVIFVLMMAGLWAQKAIGNVAPLLIPILGFAGFVAWVNRLKK